MSITRLREVASEWYDTPQAMGWLMRTLVEKIHGIEEGVPPAGIPVADTPQVTRVSPGMKAELVKPKPTSQMPAPSGSVKKALKESK